MENNLEPWVDTDSVAMHMKKSYSYVRNLAKSKTIPCVELGSGKNKRRIFKLSQVDAALNERMQKTA